MRSLSAIASDSLIVVPRVLPKVLFTLLATTWVSGCSVLGLSSPWEDEAVQSPDHALIAANLTRSMAQLPDLNPRLATVQVSRPATTFDRSIQNELEDLGYKLEPASDNSQRNLVKTQISPVVIAGIGKQSLYTLRIGAVSVERAYDTVAGKTVPVSELVVRAAAFESLQANGVDLNDDIFEVPDSPFSTVAYEPIDTSLTRNNYTAKATETVVSAASNPPQAKRLDPLSGGPIRNNMYGTMESNYSQVFKKYDEVEKQTLIFPNDSLYIGDDNKDIIEELASRMNPDTDVLSVIGCSHGNTEINNGNSLLALGRANRVKESFLFLGVAHNQVLEEGCWAPELFEPMPKRGVVVSLKRRKDS